MFVGVGKRVLRIDTTKVAKCGVPSAEDPIKCPVEKLIDGVQFVGEHDGEVTDLSMCQGMITTRLVSASMDGTVSFFPFCWLCLVNCNLHHLPFLHISFGQVSSET